MQCYKHTHTIKYLDWNPAFKRETVLFYFTDIWIWS